MNQTIVFWIYDKDEYEAEAEDADDVVVHFWDRALDCDIDPQESVALDMDEMLIAALREAISIVHSDVPGLEEDLSELGESFSDSGFLISQEVYHKAVELMRAKIAEIDDEVEQIGVDVDLREFNNAFDSVNWDTQVVFANT